MALCSRTAVCSWTGNSTPSTTSPVEDLKQGAAFSFSAGHKWMTFETLWDSRQCVFTADILAYHNWKIVGVIDYTKKGCIPCKWCCFRVILLYSLTHWHDLQGCLMERLMKMCSSKKQQKKPNVCCEKGLWLTTQKRDRLKVLSSIVYTSSICREESSSKLP